MEGIDVVVTPVVFILGAVLHSAMTRSLTTREQGIANASFLLHSVSGVAQVLLTLHYFGGGDMFQYYSDAQLNAALLRDDFVRFAPALVDVVFRTGDVLPPLVTFGGATSASMGGLASWLVFLTADSLYGTVMVISVLSYVSKVMLSRALLPFFPPENRRDVLIGVLLLPSAVFWSCGLLKEPMVMVFIGPLMLGLSWLAQGRRRVLAIVLVVFFSTLVALLKPYIIMAMSVAAGVFYLRGRVPSFWGIITRPASLAVAVIIGMFGFSLGSNYFTKAEGEQPGSAFAQQRDAFRAGGGGSSFELEAQGPDESSGGGGMGREVLLAPFALFTALFRPLIFEARNSMQLANAIEATVLSVLFVQIVRRRGLRQLGAQVLNSPVLLFSTLFVVALGIGTGLATTNMGSLSRYRAPMMPFFFVLLLVLRTPEHPQPETVDLPAPV